MKTSYHTFFFVILLIDLDLYLTGILLIFCHHLAAFVMTVMLFFFPFEVLNHIKPLIFGRLFFLSKAALNLLTHRNKEL